MATPTEQFFADLSHHGHEPLLRRTAGTIRFDIGPAAKPQRWLVELDHGDISVSRRNRGADCVVQADAEAFDRIVTGEDDGFAAYLRGAFVATGKLDLLQLFQRLFPAGGAARGSAGRP